MHYWGFHRTIQPGGYWPEVWWEFNANKSTWSITAAADSWGEYTNHLRTYRFRATAVTARRTTPKSARGGTATTADLMHLTGSGQAVSSHAHLGVDGFGDHTSAGLIQLNTRWALTASERRSVTCHEMGHSLGLYHFSGAGSCMDASAYSFATYPVAHDYDVLNGVYNGHHPISAGGGGCGKPIAPGVQEVPGYPTPLTAHELHVIAAANAATDPRLQPKPHPLPQPVSPNIIPC